VERELVQNLAPARAQDRPPTEQVTHHHDARDDPEPCNDPGQEAPPSSTRAECGEHAIRPALEPIRPGSHERMAGAARHRPAPDGGWALSPRRPPRVAGPRVSCAAGLRAPTPSRYV